ncbi:prepilin-type N-terminal cleavage/methylation domain-containing protein [Candidatus Saccharibacteria bacterium]|nr:prepilin-type N-terminal cleavage/methylation domain-containing protein [Candidatus Saccharibacteria bacterium]
MQKLNQKGFTIIELLVVIVIIGILIALTLPNLFSAQARARDSDRKNELKNLQTKLETYFGDHDEYPAALSDLEPAPSGDETTGPRSDAYTYTPSANQQSYTLTASLENDSDKDAENGVYTLNSTNQDSGAEDPENP